MSYSVTVARPYAKAVFEHAKAHHTLTQWSMLLRYLAQVLSDDRIVGYMKNPMVSSEEKAAFLTNDTASMAGDEYAVFCEFVSLLASRNRLLALQGVQSLFDAMREEEEKIIQVRVVTFSAFTQDQESRLITQLKKRLNRDVSIQVSIDPSLIGGARIQAGDLVIDGSVLGQLNKLRASLAV